MRQQIVFGLFLIAFSLLKVEFQAQTLPSYVPSNGLVGWWPFNGNANDESGNGNNGTVNGATLTADRNGSSNSAYNFDGINDLIRVPHHSNLNLLGDYSINLWFRGNYQNIFNNSWTFIAKRDDNGFCCSINVPYQIFVPFNSTNYAIAGIALASGGGYSFITPPNSSPVSLDSWQNLIITNSSGNLNFYLNGMLNYSTTFSNSLRAGNTSDLLIGSVNREISAEWMNGSLDDIAIYNRALTPTEITALYTATNTNNNGGGSGSTAGTPAASVPAGIPYQAVIRDNNGAALVNTPVTVRFTLHENTTSGTTEYQETQSLTTNALGLINTQFGIGTATQGTFAGINWSNTTKFIQVEANTGAGYVDMGTQQMMSVPFAIKSNEANKLKNAGLPVYADNAAALAGGLVAGEMYRTAAGILMIVY
jgi:hypothetical protein